MNWTKEVKNLYNENDKILMKKLKNKQINGKIFHIYGSICKIRKEHLIEIPLLNQTYVHTLIMRLQLKTVLLKCFSKKHRKIIKSHQLKISLYLQ